MSHPGRCSSGRDKQTGNRYYAHGRISGKCTAWEISGCATHCRDIEDGMRLARRRVGAASSRASLFNATLGHYPKSIVVHAKIKLYLRKAELSKANSSYGYERVQATATCKFRPRALIYSKFRMSSHRPRRIKWTASCRRVGILQIGRTNLFFPREKAFQKTMPSYP
jgi:hypothetical protein